MTAKMGTPGGAFTKGTGGKTDVGHCPPTMGKNTKNGGAKSKSVNRLGSLGTRTNGAGGKVAGL